MVKMFAICNSESDIINNVNGDWKCDKKSESSNGGDTLIRGEWLGVGNARTCGKARRLRKQTPRRQRMMLVARRDVNSAGGGWLHAAQYRAALDGNTFMALVGAHFVHVVVCHHSRHVRASLYV